MLHGRWPVRKIALSNPLALPGLHLGTLPVDDIPYTFRWARVVLHATSLSQAPRVIAGSLSLGGEVSLTFMLFCLYGAHHFLPVTYQPAMILPSCPISAAPFHPLVFTFFFFFYDCIFLLFFVLFHTSTISFLCFCLSPVYFYSFFL